MKKQNVALATTSEQIKKERDLEEEVKTALAEKRNP